MKTISKVDFIETMSSMLGNTTAFVYDSNCNRFQFSASEVTDESLHPFEKAEEIYEISLIEAENSDVLDTVKDNFMEDVYGNGSKIFWAEYKNVMCYVLWYDPKY